MTKLIDVLGFPSVNLDIGKRGSGKTATGCLALEEAHGIGLNPYLMGLPKAKWDLLPDYITPIKNINVVPDNSAILMDEAYTYCYSRDFPKAFNKFLNKTIGISRQKGWLLIIASHTCRKIDVGIILDADNLVIRQPSWLHVRYERQEIRELVDQAAKFYNKCKEPIKWAYIYTEKGPVAMELSLPKFWSSDLSNAFSGLTLDEIEIEKEEEEEEDDDKGKRLEDY
jgi:hypothetical protein